VKQDGNQRTPFQDCLARALRAKLEAEREELEKGTSKYQTETSPPLAIKSRPFQSGSARYDSCRTLLKVFGDPRLVHPRPDRRRRLGQQP